MSFMFRRSPNGLVRSQNVRHTAVAADRLVSKHSQ
jgi:hypothetical protein